MFFLGSTGSVLPFVISLIALWSGFLFGYGQYISLKKTGADEKIILLENQITGIDNSFSLANYSINTGENLNKDISDDFLISAYQVEYPPVSDKHTLVYRDGIVYYRYNYLPDNRGSPFLS
jgi:hypothetical protein